jgi:hypothetical protein
MARNSLKTEKIQVMLTEHDNQRLHRIIIDSSKDSGRIISSSAYVRDLILSHIEMNELRMQTVTNENKTDAR